MESESQRDPPDRLLPGEDPESQSVADAARWNQVYGQLISAKDVLMRNLAENMARSGPEARQELGAVDEPLLAKERAGFIRRLAFWQRRQQDLQGR